MVRLDGMNTAPHMRGGHFTRAVIALAKGGGKFGEAARFAAERWGADSQPARILRAAVGAGTLGDDDWGGSLVGAWQNAVREYFDLVAETSIAGRLTNLRRVPLRVRVVNAASGAGAYWIGEGAPAPISKLEFAAETLAPLKVAALCVLTEELLDATDTDPSAETAIRDELVRVTRQALDSAFIDPSNAGAAGEMPASVTNGVSPITSTGDPKTDLAALVASFAGDLETASLIMRPSIAVSMASADYPNVGARGGELAGIPVLTSRLAPAGTIVLVDGSGVAIGEAGADVRVSRQATIEMLDDSLVQDATDGTGTSLVSLWQANAVGILAIRTVNWAVGRPGSVAMLSDVDYAPAETGT